MAKGFIGKLIPTREAGRVLNARNVAALRQAYQSVRSSLISAGIDPDKEDAEESEDDEDDQPAKPVAKKAKKTLAREAASEVFVALEAAGFSMSDLGTLLSAALNADVNRDADNYYRELRRLVDVYDDRVIYQVNWSGPFYAVDYTVTEDGIVTFGVPSLVIRKVQYITPGNATTSVTEAGDLAIDGGEVITLEEAAVNDAGKARIKLIAPGWGSSGYYPADVLRRDGPSVFKSGTKMFWDHPTAAEEAARPEGSLANLAAVLTEDARYDNDPVYGPGLYAAAEVRGGFRDAVNELAPHIGTSIRALGRARVGEVEGRRGPIVESITAAKSVDFVTTAGAGGRVLSLFEAARAGRVLSEAGIAPATNQEGIEGMPLTKEDLDQIGALVESRVNAALGPIRQQADALRDAADMREAGALVAGYLRQYRELPAIVRDRIAPELAASFERNDAGKINAEKLRESVAARVALEYRTLAEAGAPGFARLVEGFGDTRPSGGNGTGGAGDDDGFEAELATVFGEWGLSESAAKIAATGRAGTRR